MKKYVLFLFTFVFVLGLFTFNVNSVGATGPYNEPGYDAGCNKGGPYSVTTGKLCVNPVNVVGCQKGYLFSPVTGQACGENTYTDSDSVVVAKFNSLFKSTFKVGMIGEDVKSLQQFLKDESYYFGKIDGKYGRITARAVKDFRDDNEIVGTGGVVVQPPVPCPLLIDINGNVSHSCPEKPIYSKSSVVISGVSGPQTLKVNEQGTWTVQASSRDGGNLAYAVVWGDESVRAYSANNIGAALGTQSVTFTHSYSQAGTYKPVFTVTSENTIRCIQAPCFSNSGTAQTSLSVNVGDSTNPPIPTNSVTVSRPNGGEIWTKGTTQTIKWQDKEGATCPSGSYCTWAGFSYDISLYSKPTCSGDVCSGGELRTVGKGVYGFSYDWVIPNCTANSLCSSNFDIASGAYTMQVCRSGTDICDSSDSYFNIISN